MSIDRDNPKWTAYVLGELDANERAALELELESSEEAREFVEELRLAASMMKDRLAVHAEATLTPEQQFSIQAASSARTAKPAVKLWSGRALAWTGGLAAAALVLAAVSVSPLLRSPEPPAALVRSAAVQPADKTVREASDTPASSAIHENEQRDTLSVKSVYAPPAKDRQADAQALGGAGFGAGVGPGTPAVPANETIVFGVFDALKKEDRAGLQGQQGQQGQQTDTDFKLQVGAADSEASRAANMAVTSSSVQNLAPGQPAVAAGAGGRGGAAGAGGSARKSGVLSGVLGGVVRAQEEAAPPPPPPPPAPSTLMLAPLGFVDRPDAAFDRASQVYENSFISATQQPVSTFSVNVDTASYANVRRFLNQNQLPPRDSVRIEEMINYFTYDYPQAAGAPPVTGSLEVAGAPWNPEHRLVRVGVKAKDVRLSQKPSNLVFLIDVSGSMNSPERLPLLKSGLHLLVDKLTESDRVSIVTYAGASGIALQPISGDRKDVILRAIDNLRAEGSTNGGAGIQTAYELAVANFIRGSVNRVILATDGDFNVGVTDPNQLTRLIEDRATSGVFLTVLGFGNNFKDSLLGRLAQKGHGNYAFVDTINEARKVLSEQLDATLVAVAKDVKIQVEFNPGQVNAYRLLGYETRLMRAQDFNNDQKDANDMGSGQTVTALYEVVPRGVDVNGTNGEPLRYQPAAAATPKPRNGIGANEMLDLRIRYKEPEGTESKLIELPLLDRGASFTNASSDFRFAAAVAGFGLVLRDSVYKGSATLDWVLSTAQNSRGVDKNGYRDEFIRLVQHSMQIRR
jgi:Ca-activated chloride channel family protein